MMKQPLASEKAAPPRQWYATAPQRMRRRSVHGAVDVPFGTGHLRKVGSPRSACGLPSLNWPIFWDLPIAEDEDLCSECTWTARLEEVGGR